MSSNFSAQPQTFPHALFPRIKRRIPAKLSQTPHRKEGRDIRFWYFFFYSFLGFLLEVAYARLTHSPKPDRKCFLFLPLCPVYGLGALGILGVSAFLYDRPVLMALGGGLASTAAEYLTGLFYERVLGVSFWDYSGLPGNIDGKVCLPFAAAWSLLSAVLVYLIHPPLAALISLLSPDLVLPLFSLTLADGLVSLYLLKTTGSTDSLKWYARPARGVS